MFFIPFFYDERAFKALERGKYEKQNLQYLVFSIDLRPSYRMRSKECKWKATVDVMTSAGNGVLNSQISSMIGAVTDLSLDVDMKSKTYTFTKDYYSISKDESGNPVKDSNNNEVNTLELKFVFKGEVKDNKEETYTLAPATGVEYSIDLGIYYEILNPIGCIPFEAGKGTEKDDAKKLDFFYTPYLKNNGSNNSSMNVTVKDGSLSFEGFSLTEEE